MNMNAPNGCFRLPLADNRPTAPPPKLPACSMIKEQTGGSRLHVGHKYKIERFPKRDFSYLTINLFQVDIL